MKYSIVLGTQFGDEGKGSMTSNLCSKTKNPLVIRFNGGHQAGHTVLHNGIRHTFSTFGSGTLQNVPTFWSEYCTFYPTAVFNEWNKLNELGIKPKLFVHPLAPVTTPYDVLANIVEEEKNNHGSVGVGFGTTLKRHEAYYKLYFNDLFNKTILEGKLLNIRNYYKNIISNMYDEETFMPLLSSIENWLSNIQFLIENKIITKEQPQFVKYDHLIFEGAQGILLDQDFGFFPNVTRSNTTSKNAYNIIKDLKLPASDINVFYMTRPYQTRHGIGYMTNRNYPEPVLINTENEINKNGGNQGIFRKSILDLDLLKYAIETDDIFIERRYGVNKHIVITCLDQIVDKVKYTFDKTLYEKNTPELIIDIINTTKITNLIYGKSESKFTTNYSNVLV
jgi:adenylosuccinate synthase